MALTIVQILTHLILTMLQWGKCYQYQSFNSSGNWGTEKLRILVRVTQVEIDGVWTWTQVIWIQDTCCASWTYLWLGSDTKDCPYFSHLSEQSMMTKLSLVQKKIYSDSLIYIVHWTHKFTYSPINPSKTKVKGYLLKNIKAGTVFCVFAC